MLTRIPGQPISFYESNNCPKPFDTQYQLMKSGDKIQFQFKLDEPCSENPIELIENGGFQDCETSPWILNGCWTCVEVPGRSGVCWDSSQEGCDTPASLSQMITPTMGSHIYRVRFQVYNYEQGALTFQIGLFPHLVVSSNGAYEVYLDLTGLGGDLNFNFMPSTDWIGCIDNISMVQMDGNGYGVGIFNTNGDLIDFVDSINNSDLFNFTKNYVTFTYKTTEITPGCYYVCIKDFCDCPVENTTVDLENPYAVWGEQTSGGNFEYQPADGWIIFDGKSEGNAATAISPDLLCVGQPYIVEFTIGNFPTNAGIKLRNGTNSTPFYGTAGTYSLTFIAEDSKLYFDGQATGTNGLAWVNHIEIQPQQINMPTEFDYCSQPFVFYEGEEYCSLLVEGCNNSDAFGFCFVGSGFQPSVRVQAKLLPLQPKTTGLFEINSQGERSSKYAEVRNIKALRIIDTAIYIWEFLSKWVYLDTNTIDGDAYVMEENEFPEITYSKFMTRGTGSIPMGEKTQGMFKTNCSNGSNC